VHNFELGALDGETLGFERSGVLRSYGFEGSGRFLAFGSLPEAAAYPVKRPGILPVVLNRARLQLRASEAVDLGRFSTGMPEHSLISQLAGLERTPTVKAALIEAVRRATGIRDGQWRLMPDYDQLAYLGRSGELLGLVVLSAR
jgi:hypothetical protein